MKPHGARAVLAALRSLAADDKERLTAAKDRLARAREEMTAAQSVFDSASTRAEVSQRVADGAEELLPDTEQMPDDASEPPSASGTGPRPASGRGQPTLGQEIITFLRGQKRGMHRREIAAHLGVVRPDIRLSGLGPELTELVRTGALARVARGVYGMPRSAEDGDT
ncbi:type IV toxin-antitoxin system AbiEi family antitoxin domain-containing protein [Streptomyces sp. NPDC002550]